MTSTEAARASAPAPLKRTRPERTGPAKAREELDLTQLDFVGCDAVPMSPGQYRLFEGRLEVWDAELKTAWMVRESLPTFIHESPSQRLAGLAERIAAVRGSPIAYCGALGLMVADRRGDPRRVMRPDQAIYVNPTRAELEGHGAILVGEHRLPDLVMEVDNTTDVRRGKLKLYESWGFPELWVEVPDQQSPSRPAGLRPGLTIHLLEGGAYRISPVSRAFPGWRAADIHVALNEFALSERSLALVEGMGRLLGERDGTGPDDDPMLRSLRAESRAEGRAEGRTEGKAEGIAEGRSEGRTQGRAEGRAEGRTEGLAEGRTESRAGMVREMLLARGIKLSEGFLADPAALAELPESTIVAAALACGDEQDFLLRLGSRQP